MQFLLLILRKKTEIVIDLSSNMVGYCFIFVYYNFGEIITVILKFFVVSYELIAHVSKILLLCAKLFRFKQCGLHAYMSLIFVKVILENYATDNWIEYIQYS